MQNIRNKLIVGGAVLRLLAKEELQRLAIALVAMILCCVVVRAQAVRGTGTTNTIPVWTTGSTVGDSIMSQSGGNINVSGGLVATSLSGKGSGVTGVNALTLGGLSPSAFPQLSLSNIFTTGQTINGTLTLSGAINGTLTLQGNLTDTTGDQGANVIGGFGGSSSFPGNSVAGGVLGATIAGGGGALCGTSPCTNAPNAVLANWGTVGGGVGNTANYGATVAGGQGNTAGYISTVGGGVGNTAIYGATVAGGQGNTAGSGSYYYATVAGGQGNTASSNWTTVAGGWDNTASSSYATVGGGAGNTASGQNAAVGGGFENFASGVSSIVAGGAGNTASGQNAAVGGGSGNIAAGAYSSAAGCAAKANNAGSFVWSGAISSTTCSSVSDSAAGQFIALAPGGFTFYTSPALTGATLASGSGSWSMVSDRNVKANFGAVDGQDLLARLAAIPVSTWNYTAQPDLVRHMGPMAQDFRAAFGLGEDDKHISTVDAEGVALAAIQALYETVIELKRDLGDKDEQIAALRARLARMEQRQ